MTDERWRLAFAIYESVASLAGPERQAYIHAAAPDQEIADRVLAMLDEIRAASDGDGFPEPASSNYPCPEPPASSLSNGTSVGRFVRHRNSLYIKWVMATLGPSSSDR